MLRILRGTTKLADGNLAGLGVVSKLTINGQHLIDEAGFFNADAVTLFDRDLGALDVQFTITRQHATGAESMDHRARHFQAVRGVEDFTLQFAEDGQLFAWLGAGSGWKTVQPDGLGLTTVTQYGLRVPELALQSPELDPLAGGGNYDTVYTERALDLGHYGDLQIYGETIDGGAYV